MHVALNAVINLGGPRAVQRRAEYAQRFLISSLRGLNRGESSHYERGNRKKEHCTKHEAHENFQPLWKPGGRSAGSFPEQRLVIEPRR